MPDSGVLPRLVAATAALVLGIAAALIVVQLAHRTPGPVPATASPGTSTSTPAAPTEKTGFPAPPKNAVVFSRADGSDVLALAVVPGRMLGLQASVVGGQGEGVDGLGISFRVGAHMAAAQSCGAGCYRASVARGRSPATVEVNVRRSGRTTHWAVPLPRPWPPPDASALVASATRTFNNLRTLIVHDRLASDPQHAVVTRWTLVAPNRLAYQIENGPAAVIIGNTRWDKLVGQGWKRSGQTPIRQPVAFWTAWTDAHVVGSTKNAWRVTFFDPKSPAWYEIVVAKDSARTLDLKMNTTAHFMHEVYGPFNAPQHIGPPR
jgi:hypothetical protein